MKKYGLLLLACCMSFHANAEYEVTIEAPKPIAKLLEQFLDLARYKDRKDLSEDQFNFMLATVSKQVNELIATEGYFSGSTKVEVKNAEAKAGVGDTKDGKRTVILTVDPGPLTKVASVDLRVSGSIQQEAPQQVDELVKQWPLDKEQPFRQQDWAEAKDKTLQSLRNHRYAAAEMTASEARILADKQQAELSMDLNSGPTFTLGELQIKGTKRYPARIIENINPLQVGEYYDVDRLLSLQRQIQRSPYFSNAIIDIQRDPAHPERTPVSVDVTEFPTQRIRAGVGYSTDTGANVEGRYSHNNVFGRAWVFDAQTKIEQRRQSASLDLAMPPDRTGFVNSANYTYRRTTLEGIDLRSERYGLWRSRKTDKLDLAFKVQFYRDSLQQLNGADLPTDIVVQPGDHKALVTSVEWTYRDVDNLVFPRRGYIFSSDLGVALKSLLSDENFFRADTQLRHYFPVGERDLVILKGELGAVISKGGNTSIPASLLFRAGGTDSIRGYSYLSIGNEINGRVYPTRYLATASAEYQHWFRPQWGAAVFYDVGTATDNWPDKQIFQGVGVGARWRSPVGPVNADLGYGIERGEINPHFSLGVAF